MVLSSPFYCIWLHFGPLNSAPFLYLQYHSILFYSTSLYPIPFCTTTQHLVYSIILPSTPLYYLSFLSTPHDSIKFHFIICYCILFHSFLYHNIPHHSIPLHSILYHTTVFHTILHSVPFHTIPLHSTPTIPYYSIPVHSMQFPPFHSNSFIPVPYLVQGLKGKFGVTPAVIFFCLRSLRLLHVAW